MRCRQQSVLQTSAGCWNRTALRVRRSADGGSLSAMTESELDALRDDEKARDQVSRGYGTTSLSTLTVATRTWPFAPGRCPSRRITH